VVFTIVDNSFGGIRVANSMEIIATAGVLLGFLAMLVARMALIVEAFVCLRSVGGTTLQSVSWTKYIPHFS
jgi:hypothetical protein